jgi:uncharacterized membrane protein
MASLSEAKTLGGIGSILVVLAFVPFAGPVLAVVGFIMTLIAVKYIADIVGDRTIFNNMLIAVILGIVGIIVGSLLVFASLFRFVGLGGFEPAFGGGPPPADVFGLIVSLIVGLAIIWILFIVEAIFVRRSFASIAAKVNVGTFRTAATFYLIGAVLVIIVVGFVLLFVGQIIQIVAFFSLPEQAAQPPLPPPPPAPAQS